MSSEKALTPEEQLQQLLVALNQTHAIVKSHSFQIVSLKNQLELMQNAMAEEAEERKRLVQDNQQLTTNIVYLKGRLAKMTVEFYHAQVTTSLAPTSPYDSKGRRSTSRWTTRHNNNSNTSSSKLIAPQEEEARPRSRAVETVADRMLVEQRSLLVRGLQDLEQMTQSLSAETRHQLNELDQAYFYDARENVTDDNKNIKTEGTDSSFSLEDGWLRAPPAENST